MILKKRKRRLRNKMLVYLKCVVMKNLFDCFPVAILTLVTLTLVTLTPSEESEIYGAGCGECGGNSSQDRCPGANRPGCEVNPDNTSECVIAGTKQSSRELSENDDGGWTCDGADSSKECDNDKQADCGKLATFECRRHPRPDEEDEDDCIELYTLTNNTRQIPICDTFGF